MERLCREEAYGMVAMPIMNPVEKKGEEIKDFIPTNR